MPMAYQKTHEKSQKTTTSRKFCKLNLMERPDSPMLNCPIHIYKADGNHERKCTNE